MTIKIRGVKPVHINGEYIRLDALLKYASIVSTGGEAKNMINDGTVYVGKEVCLQRGRKIRPGDLVKYRNCSNTHWLIIHNDSK